MIGNGADLGGFGEAIGVVKAGPPWDASRRVIVDPARDRWPGAEAVEAALSRLEGVKPATNMSA